MESEEKGLFKDSVNQLNCHFCDFEIKADHTKSKKIGYPLN